MRPPLLVLCALAAAMMAVPTTVSAKAQSPDVLRVYMYNSSSVAKSTCQLMGYLPNSAMRRPFKIFIHKGKGKKVYSKAIPKKYTKVAVVCRANGPIAQTIVSPTRRPYGDAWVKSSCGSSKRDVKCAVSELGGDPD